jgi:hypothetical protein
MKAHQFNPVKCGKYALVLMIGHFRNSIQRWLERQVAFIRYILLNDRKDFLNILMVDSVCFGHVRFAPKADLRPVINN